MHNRRGLLAFTTRRWAKWPGVRGGVMKLDCVQRCGLLLGWVGMVWGLL